MKPSNGRFEFIVGFVLLLALLTCAKAKAQGSLDVGASVTFSESLGYESPYPGVTVQGDYSRGAFVSRGEASYLWAEKIQTGEGSAQSAKALAGVRWRSLDLMAGASYSRQDTDAYEKDATRRIAELGWTHKAFRAALTYSGNDGREASESFGVRVSGGNRLRVVGEYERIEFTTYFGEEFTGDKVTVSWLWRFI